MAEDGCDAIPEAHAPDYAFGYGDLSVHQVAVDPTDPDLAYLSYYGGGVRAVQIQCTNPADTSTRELVEVGDYIDEQDESNFGRLGLDRPQRRPGVHLGQ